MALIRRIDSSGLVKGYIDDGNFDGFLIHARKGLLKLLRTDSGRKERKEEERKESPSCSSFFFLLRSQNAKGSRNPSSMRSFFLSRLPFSIDPYYSFIKLDLRILFRPADIFAIRRNQDFVLYHS